MPTERNVNVKGVIAEQRAEVSARIKVLAYKKNDKYIYDSEEIKLEFPPTGHVFAPNILAEEDWKLNDLIEFSTMPFTSNGPDIFKLDLKYSKKRVGLEVFRVDHDILDNQHALDQPKLKLFIPEAIGSFYILNYSILFGPFKSYAGEVVPINDTKVERFHEPPPIVNINGKLYLLEKPKELGEKVDCSRPLELASWFKKHIRSININPTEIQQLLQQIEQIELPDLGNAKLSRIANLTKNVLLNREELIVLSKSSTTFQEILTTSFQNLREEIRLSEMVSVEEELLKIKKEIDALRLTYKKLKEEINNNTLAAEALKKEITFLEENKDRLINDIKISSQVATLPSSHRTTESINTYEVQSYLSLNRPFVDLQEFIVCYKMLFEYGETETGKGKRILFQLRNSHAFLCANPVLIKQIADFSNNCTLFIQQVEPDWLKFESFYNNGLKQIWLSAYNQPEIIHFLILEDINMSPIECYGKPLLDLLAGVRQNLPGLQLPWPDNLWIFGIPIEKTEDEGFGVPLLERTFKDWRGIPIYSSICREVEKDPRYLPVQALLNHEYDSESSLNNYFL